GDDTMAPRSEWLATPESVDGLVCLHECLLRQILGIIPIAHDTPGNRHDTLHVFANKIVVRVRIAGLDRFDSPSLKWICLTRGIPLFQGTSVFEVSVEEPDSGLLEDGDA